MIKETLVLAILIFSFLRTFVFGSNVVPEGWLEVNAFVETTPKPDITYTKFDEDIDIPHLNNLVSFWRKEEEGIIGLKLYIYLLMNREALLIRQELRE